VIAMSRYALPLSGYDNASIWGYDEQDATYFAMLWRNTSESRDDPDFWLNWFTEKMPISSAARLALMIAVRTEHAAVDVFRALAAATTAPEAQEMAELSKALPKSAV
jgi:hypothetical protein